MTMHQAGVNARVVAAEAERLEAQGYRGDAHQFVEQLLLRAIADGYKPVERPAPLTGSGSTPEAREAAREALKAALAANRERRRTTNPPVQSPDFDGASRHD